jgi:hypothetical protein
MNNTQQQAQTFVPSEDGYTSITTQPGDTVYVMGQNGQYQHTAHIVRRVANGLAVTCCTIWARRGTVAPLERDCFVWCENGCRQARLQQDSE